MSTLLLDRKAVKSLLNMTDVIEAVEKAFEDVGEGRANMPPKAYLSVDKGDFRAMPASLPGCAGVKWVNSHPYNRKKNLPSVMAVLIFNDPQTGYPLAVMDGTEITAFRTGAAAAIASKYLARRDSRTLGLIGAGRQAYTQVLAHAGLFNLEMINVFDISEDASDKLIAAFPELPIRKCSLQEAVVSDIVCTLTPSREPVVEREWVIAGTHINAVGADGPGKQELEAQILKDAKVVVDDIRQSSSGGEINVPIRQERYSADKVYCTLAELVTGQMKGRTDNEEITVFDSTGIAIQDIAVAKIVYEKAKHGNYTSIDLVEE